MVRTLLITLALSLSACSTKTQVPLGPMVWCPETLSPVDRYDDTLGFTADEVLELLRASTPSGVAWSSWSIGATEATVEMEIGEVSGDVYHTVEPALNDGTGDYCDGPTVLRFAVEMSVVLDGGDVVASGEEQINAAALDIDQILFAGDDNRIPATLSGAYLDEAEAYIADGPQPDQVITEVTLSMGHFWSSSDFDLGALRSNGVDTQDSAFWRGPWSWPAADTADTGP